MAENSPQEQRWLAANLKGKVFPQTVVDVGVGRGTPQLYEAFPEAFQVLIEPLSEHEAGLREILKSYRGAYFLTAAGARDGKLDINVEPRRIAMSSFLERTELTATGRHLEKREVRLTTLDTLMKEYDLRPPFGLKIDAEGFEYQVIEGAPAFLRKTQFVIAEVSLGQRFKEGYTFHDFAEIMNANGFYLWDILHIGGKKFVDAVFRPSLGHQSSLSVLSRIRLARLRATYLARQYLRRRH